MPDDHPPRPSITAAAQVAAPNSAVRPAAGGNGDGWLRRFLRTLSGSRPETLRADLQQFLEAGGAGETGFSPEEFAMLKNIVGLRERQIVDVMIPRADIVAVQRSISLGELMKVFESAGHSRLVVYDDTLDDPVGMVHIRDLVAFMAARASKEGAAAEPGTALPAGIDLKAVDLSMPLSAANIVRKLLFVPPSMRAIDLLVKMQASRVHLALVIDEYGGADGLVSIEDLVEQIVGEIDDEHDEDELPDIAQQPDGSFLADARASLEEVTAIVGKEFDVGEAAEDVDTLGGYLVAQVGRVPVRGELVTGPTGFEIEVLDADPRRVKRLRIYRRKQPRAARARESRRRVGEAESTLAPTSPHSPQTERSASGDASPAASGDASANDNRRS